MTRALLADKASILRNLLTPSIVASPDHSLPSNVTGVCVGVGVNVGLPEGVGVRVSVGVRVGVAVRVSVGVRVDVGVKVWVMVGVLVIVGVFERVGVLLRVKVGVGVLVAVFVGVGVKGVRTISNRVLSVTDTMKLAGGNDWDESVTERIPGIPIGSVPVPVAGRL